MKVSEHAHTHTYTLKHIPTTHTYALKQSHCKHKGQDGPILLLKPSCHVTSQNQEVLISEPRATEIPVEGRWRGCIDTERERKKKERERLKERERERLKEIMDDGPRFLKSHHGWLHFVWISFPLSIGWYVNSTRFHFLPLAIVLTTHVPIHKASLQVFPPLTQHDKAVG